MSQDVSRHSLRFLIAATLLFGQAYAADTSPRAELKTGWTVEVVSAFAAGCAEAIVLPARQQYAAAAARSGNASPKAFPEEELRASVGPMCSCVALRIAATWTPAEVAQGSPEKVKPFIEEAMSGGQCKPEGILGQLILRGRN